MQRAMTISAVRCALLACILSAAGAVQPARASLNCGLLIGATQVPFYDKPNGAIVGNVDVAPGWKGKTIAVSGDATDNSIWFEVSDGTKVLGFMKPNEGGVACTGDF